LSGGRAIVNTNDLAGGLEKIGREQNEYYILGYSPADAPEGSCHTLKVKVDRGGTLVRARSGYCNIKPVDYLAGNSVEKDLENRVAGTAAGSVKASMQTPFFYTSPNTARVNMATSVAASSGEPWWTRPPTPASPASNTRSTTSLASFLDAFARS
jgi:hypothetical protein